MSQLEPRSLKSEIEQCAQLARELRELCGIPEVPDLPEQGEVPDLENEIAVEVAAACKRAIRDANLSRAQVLDLVNAYLGRTREEERVGERKPISIATFHNYLSRPSEYVMRLPVVHAICKVTGSMAPYKVLVSDLGGRIIDVDEVAELQLGKIESLTRQLVCLRRALLTIMGGDAEAMVD
jgi:hypothetical protein